MSDVWQLGVDADDMIDLPDVVLVNSPLVRVGGSAQSLEGASTMQTLAMKHQPVLTFDYLTDDDYDTVLQFYDGRKGKGPFLYQDPRYETAWTVNIVSLDDNSDLAGYRTSGGSGPQLTLQEV